MKSVPHIVQHLITGHLGVQGADIISYNAVLNALGKGNFAANKLPAPCG